MKCSAGIWIDCKQLLPHTRRLVSSLTEFDRDVIGKELVRLNVEMIRDFALAYRLRDEHLVYDNGKVVRDIKIAGHKRGYLDRFVGDLQSYEALIEFTFDELEFLGYHILPHRIHINRRVVGRARSAIRSTTRGKNNYRDSVNSYLGMIKGTSDLKAARQILDSVSGKKYKKDYNEYKIMVL